MIADLDIWRTANLPLKQHGDDAPVIAAQRADALLAKGDVDGQRVWMRILHAVEELARAVRRHDEGVN